MKKVIAGQPHRVIVRFMRALEWCVRVCSLISIFLMLFILTFPSLSVAAVTVTHFLLPDDLPGHNILRLNGIITGPDGNLWFGLNNVPDAIGRMTLDGDFTFFLIPAYEPLSITVGPDGNFWFIEQVPGRMVRMTPEGVFTEYEFPPDPNPNYNVQPNNITAGPDGNLWVTTSSLGPKGIGIVQMTPGGAMTEFPVPGVSGLIQGITAGPDGNLWFTDRTGNNIGRMTLGGAVTLFPIPTTNSQPLSITASPDGNLWFTECSGNKIGRITTEGVITEYAVYSASSCPGGITAGPDGNIWFTEQNTNKIGHTPPGASNEFSVYNAPGGLTVGADGNIWVANADYMIDQVSGIGTALTLRLMHLSNPINTYGTFQAAYTPAVSGDVIQAQSVDLTGPLTFDKDIDVTFKGGYDAAFVLNTGNTTVKDSITIKGGKVTVEKVVIK
jgi:streptogramin lyase